MDKESRYCLSGIELWEEEPGLEDLILDGMGATMATLMELSGVDANTAVVDCEGEPLWVTINEREPSIEPLFRLDDIIRMAREASKMRPDIPFEELVKGILRADGWSVTENALRTPLWMSESMEFGRIELSEWKEFGWLAKCTSL